MSKGKIIYIGGFELPDKNAAAHRVISNGKALRDLGYEVIFIGITKDEVGPINVREDSFFDFNCYSQKRPTGLKEWVNYFINIDQYKEIIQKYTNVKSIICYNMPSGSMYLLKKYCTKHNIKIFSDCTEWYKGTLKGNVAIGLFKRFDSLIRMHYVQKKLDGVIAISSYLEDFYSIKGVKTILIPPLVDCMDQKWQESATNRSSDLIQIVYAGGAFSIDNSYVKDRLDLVVEALSELKKDGFIFSFHVVGCTLDDFQQFYPQLNSCINTLDESIKFFGKVNHEHTIELVKNAHYSIFLRDESIVTLAGFPTKFVESISCGTLVLTNNNSNVLDYLSNGENGFSIDSSSVESIKNSLKKPLSYNITELIELNKKTLDSKLFDYRKHLDIFKLFYP